MMRIYSASLFAVVFLLVSSRHGEAQIAFSVTQQNGIVTGGGFRVGGVIMPGATGVRLGINAGTSQLIGVQQFTFQSNRSAGPARSNQQVQRPSAGQFIKAAKRFDRNDDNRLDKDELNKVAAAVVAELRQRRGQTDQKSSIQFDDPDRPSAIPSAQKMVESFVKRCLTYDKDKDEALDQAETKRMATAFIRSLR